jgi:hypothetical protein
MKRLEKFIREHRDEFDDLEPSEKLWSNISGAVSPSASRNISLKAIMKWSIAAAVLVLIATVSYKWAFKQTPAEKDTISTVKPAKTDLQALEPEDAPEMNQFAKMIALKQEELKALSKEQPQLYLKFSKDFTQLDSSYRILKEKLGITPNRELLIEAMIQNLQLQLDVLNQQLNIIQQIKQSKKSSDEKNKSFT